MCYLPVHMLYHVSLYSWNICQTFYFIWGCKLLSVDLNNKVVLEMFGSSQPRNINQQALLYLNK